MLGCVKAVRMLRSYRRVPIAGAPLGGLRRDIVRALIDEQTLALDALSATYGGGTKARVELVWSAGTLGNSDWANELHPKPNAFNRLVGECWRKSARKAMGLP